MRVVAIPVKPLSRSKSRLAPELTPLERGALTLAMLEDVLDVTLEVPAWDTWVVSADEAVLEIPAPRGAAGRPADAHARRAHFRAPHARDRRRRAVDRPRRHQPAAAPAAEGDPG